MSWKAIYDTTTGQIVANIFGSTDTHTANTDVGQAAIDPTDTSYPEDGANRYVDDPGGTPTLADRPANDCIIPEVCPEGAALTIADCPDGAEITITLSSDGSAVHSGTKSGGPGDYDAASLGTTEGQIMFVEVGGFPLRTVTGLVEVTAPL